MLTFIDEKNLLTTEKRESLCALSLASFQLKDFCNLNEVCERLNLKIVIKEQTSPRSYITPDLEKERERLLEKLQQILNGGPSINGRAIARIDKRLQEIKALESVVVFGEYIPSQSCINLYVKTIMECHDFIERVFVHEVMHAFFDRDEVRKAIPYILEVEEPLAEAGTLYFAEKVGDSKAGYSLSDAHKIVAKGIYPYKKGETLFKKHHDETWDVVQTYKSIGAAGRVKRYLKGAPIETIKSKRNKFERFLRFLGYSEFDAAVQAALPLKDEVKTALGECSLYDISDKHTLQHAAKNIKSEELLELIENFGRFLEIPKCLEYKHKENY